MRSHVTATVCLCFATLRQISSIRHSLSCPALLTLIRALVISKLDYCCSVLAGAPETLLHRLQSVLNAVARLVFSARKTKHTSPLLRELHWLNLPELIKFRLCALTYRCLHGTAPLQATLPTPFVQFPALLRGVISDLLTRRLCWCRQLAVRHWVTARFRRLQQEPGIRCLVMSGTCLPCSPFAANSRLYCLGCRTLSIDSFSTVS